jgi:hypothetical protein
MPNERTSSVYILARRTNAARHSWIQKAQTLPIKVGKRVGHDLYIHRSAIYALYPAMTSLLLRAERLAGGTHWNATRLRSLSASLLLCEDFDAAAFPALLAACTVKVHNGAVKHTCYQPYQSADSASQGAVAWRRTIRASPPVGGCRDPRSSGGGVDGRILIARCASTSGSSSNR